MRKVTLILTALFPILSFTAEGMDMASSKNIVFSCQTTENESVMVKKIGKDYEYTQGNLAFKNAVNQVLANERSEIAVGSGFTTYSLELQHQGKSYVIGFIQARGSESIEEPGISIYKGEMLEKALSCDSTSIYHNFDTKKMRTMP
jgi:hypothetical protein